MKFRLGAALALVLSLSAPARAADLVDVASRYEGTNPGGWGFAWCAAFLRWIAPQAGVAVPGTNDLASSFLLLPHEPGPKRGQIAVITWTHRRAEHVAIVEGADASGIHIVGGNQGHRVGHMTIRPDNVLAYVDPLPASASPAVAAIDRAIGLRRDHHHHRRHRARR